MKVDPRAKILILILVDILIIVKNPILFHTGLFLILLGIAAIIGKKKFVSFFKGFSPMMITVFLIGWLFISIGDGILLTLRFGELVLSSFIFFQTTTVDEMSKALLALKLSYSFVFIFSSAVRYVDLISIKFKEIKEAQKARGIDMRLKNFHAILLPLIVGIFVLAEDLAEALESRGFTCKKRTIFRPLHWRWNDTLVSLMSLVLFVYLLISVK